MTALGRSGGGGRFGWLACVGYFLAHFANGVQPRKNPLHLCLLSVSPAAAFGEMLFQSQDTKHEHPKKNGDKNQDGHAKDVAVAATEIFPRGEHR
jgi:hypothetical protein